jgi:Bardet-Biedl syndrome 1 protein
VGVLEGEHRISIATREGKLYWIYNNDLCLNPIEITSKPCAIARCDVNLYVGCMDKNVYTYVWNKGYQKSYSLGMPGYITNLEAMELGKVKELSVIDPFR